MQGVKPARAPQSQSCRARADNLHGSELGASERGAVHHIRLIIDGIPKAPCVCTLLSFASAAASRITLIPLTGRERNIHSHDTLIHYIIKH